MNAEIISIARKLSKNAFVGARLRVRAVNEADCGCKCIRRSEGGAVVTPRLKPGPKPGSPRRADAKRPGPKPTGNAKTYAERCRAYRERKKLKISVESS